MHTKNNSLYRKQFNNKNYTFSENKLLAIGYLMKTKNQQNRMRISYLLS